jgi:hypothetical protein
MAWKIVNRKIGRAGSVKRRENQQREWDRRYGEENWAVGYIYIIEGEFVLQEEVIESVYYCSYEEHFQQYPKDLQELIQLAKVLRNPHAQATTSVDIQIPAIMEYLKCHNLTLQGTEVVDIGTWQGQYSHPILEPRI